MPDHSASVERSIKPKGEKIYKKMCAACHQLDGKGVGNFPTLVNSDYMLMDTERTIKTILYGTEHSIIVNGVEYPGSTMPHFDYLSNNEIAEIANYILNSWGNNGGIVTPEMVASNR